METDFEIVTLPERPEQTERAARWFHEKWGVPLEAYLESMEECLAGKTPVPQWYLALKHERIVGGLGVIEHDFHDRKDLAPNICALYTEKAERGRGIAGALLGRACADMKAWGIHTLYLITDHTYFYERYGWEFLCMVREEGSAAMTRMYVHSGGGENV